MSKLLFRKVDKTATKFCISLIIVMWSHSFFLSYFVPYSLHFLSFLEVSFLFSYVFISFLLANFVSFFSSVFLRFIPFFFLFSFVPFIPVLTRINPMQGSRLIKSHPSLRFKRSLPPTPPTTENFPTTQFQLKWDT